jgi:hypothetical protein
MRIAPCRIGGLAAMGLALVSVGGVGGAAGASTSAPYTDPNAVGYIGLCDQAGQQITSGNINTTPFAWRAVSSEPAQAPYNNAYRTAILLAYQPQEGLAPGEWSGDELTASSRYTNPANPMVAATDGDDSLEDFIGDFQPKWDGFIELRIYLGTENAQTYSLHYPALNIQVTGDTWTAVGGGTVNCASGTAESLESIVLPPTTTTTAAPTTTTSPGAGKSPTTTTTAGQGSHSLKSATGKVAGTASGSGSGTNDALIAGVAVAALAVLGGSAYLIIRRRRHTSELHETP